MSRLLTAEEAQSITENLRLYNKPRIIGDLAHAVVALEADLANRRIEHKAHTALLSSARLDRDEARARIAVLEEEHRRDLADVEHFRKMARGYMDERDEARDFIAREGYQPCTSAACNCGAWHKATP